MRNYVLAGALMASLGGGVVNAADVETIARACNGCHGTGGVSVGHSMPSIAGLPEAYLKNIMMEWKSGARDSANMGRLIKGYTDEEIAGLATYFSKLPWTPVAQHTTVSTSKGMEVTERCETCHGKTGSEPDDAATPKLNGQWAKYMELELAKYRSSAFKMPHKKMTKNAQKMEEDAVATAAQFYGSQSK